MTKSKIPKTGSNMPFIPHLHSLLMNAALQVQTNHLNTFEKLGQMIWLSEFWVRQVRGFRYEDLRLLRFHLQMLNDEVWKPNNETYLKRKYQKNVATDKKSILWIMGLKFRNTKINILWKLALYNVMASLEPRAQWGHSEKNNSGWIRLYVSFF